MPRTRQLFAHRASKTTVQVLQRRRQHRRIAHHLHQSWIAVVGIVFGGVSGLVYAIRVALAANKDPKLQDDDTSIRGQDGGGPGKGSEGPGS